MSRRGDDTARPATGAGRPVRVDLLVSAVRQEYRELGRLVHEREFSRYLELLR